MGNPPLSVSWEHKSPRAPLNEVLNVSNEGPNLKPFKYDLKGRKSSDFPVQYFHKKLKEMGSSDSGS